MDAFEAIVLGIVQGLTEFLPISSSGHLRIVPAFFGWEDPGAAFTAVVQLGTMAAVLLYFRKDLWEIVTGWLRGLRDPQDRKSTRLNSSHANISYAVFCLKKKKKNTVLIVHSLQYILRHTTQNPRLYM